jgi:hypothetical protein
MFIAAALFFAAGACAAAAAPDAPALARYRGSKPNVIILFAVRLSSSHLKRGRQPRPAANALVTQPIAHRTTLAGVMLGTTTPT